MHTAPANNIARLLAGALILAAPATAAPVNVCGVLSPEAIRQSTGEAATATKPTSQTVGKVRYSQCFYALPTFANSISITVTGPAGLSHDSARELWDRWFHRRDDDKDADKEKNKAGERGQPQPESEMEEAAAKAVPLAGIGDEAFWVQSFVGNLYVRKGNQFLRISIGGKGTDEERQAKAKALAADALHRLH